MKCPLINIFECNMKGTDFDFESLVLHLMRDHETETLARMVAMMFWKKQV